MNRTRTIFLATIFLTAALLVGSWINSRPAESYTPPQSGTTYPLFATPALLAAAPVANLPSGAQAWVAQMGPWTFQTSCLSSCDGTNAGSCLADAATGCTCVTAGAVDGGVGCWYRNVAGVPGAQTEINWYANSVSGNDTNNCTTSGTPCLTLSEIIRRIGQQPFSGAQFGSQTIWLSGSFANFTGTFAAPLQNGSIAAGGIYIQGSRTYTGADGGPLFSGVVSSWQGWDAGIEGIAYVVAAVDGGPAFDPAAWPATGGYMLEDTSQCGGGLPLPGSNGCLAIPIGPKLDGGVFATPGGTQPGSYVSYFPAPGDNVRIAQMTPLSTTAGNVVIQGVGLTGYNLWIGGVGMQASVTVEFDSCVLDNPGSFGALDVYLLGDSIIDTFNMWGGNADYVVSSYFDRINLHENAYLELDGFNLIGFGSGYGLTVGAGPQGDEGPASVYAPGIFGCEGAGTCLTDFWGSAIMTVPMVCHNTNTGSCVTVSAGGNYVRYSNASVGPKVTGTAPYSPYYLGGALYDGGLPVVCDAGLACGIIDVF